MTRLYRRQICLQDLTACFTGSVIPPLPRRPGDLRHVALHVTGEDIADDGTTTTPEQVIGALRRLSLYDCVRMIGRLEATLYISENRYSPQLHQELIDRLVAPVAPKLAERLAALLKRGQIPFFEQQLYHLARLAVLHADLREPDDFAEGRNAADFLFCAFGVTDSFDDLQHPESDDDVLSWALRQAAMNQNEERLTLWSFYFELFDRIWPELQEAPDPEDAFRRYTGLSLGEYLALGFAFSAGFGRQPEGAPPQAQLDPHHWFSTSLVTEDEWRSFLAIAGGTPNELRAALEAETAEFGPTNYLSLAIERTPILIAPDDRLYVLSVAALERRATHGIFHILAEGAVAEGEDRERYTAPFGAAFQRWAERCIRRIEAERPSPPQIFADARYGPKGRERDTPDTVLRYERQLVAAEMVAGPLRIKTLTHGDLDSFELDLEKLVLKKADQLTKRIGDMKDGATAEIGLDTDGVVRIWPALITAAPFPIWPLITLTIRQRLKDEGLLQGKLIAPISIISAEELAAAEGESIATGTALVSLLSEWKSHATTGDHSLKNHLVKRAAGRGESVPAAEHHRELFDEASRAMFTRLFGHPGPPTGDASEH